MCNGTSCVVAPTCGDGTCNGNETQATCCRDCGCPSSETCSTQGTCAASCSTETIDFANDTGNGAGICALSGETYELPSEMYISAASSPGQTFEVNFLGYTTDSLNLGQSDSGTYQCCWVDPIGCVGYTGTCRTSQYGTIACLCTAAKSWSVTADSCSSRTLSLCN